MRDALMNTENIKFVADQLAEMPESQFNTDLWLGHADLGNAAVPKRMCDTVACIADRILILLEEDWLMKQERARKILGLDGKAAVKLFHAEGYPGDRSSVTVEQAVKTLRRPARTSRNE